MLPRPEGAMLRSIIACSALVLLLSDAASAQVATVDFDNPTPQGASSDLLQGEFQGIDFGTTQWRWESAFDVNPTNHIYFDSATGDSRTLSFSTAPVLLQSVTAFAASATQLTLSDDTGQTLSVAITPGAQQLVVTGRIPRQL
jgi:hypothetical protein